MIPIPDIGLQLSGRAGGKSGRALLSEIQELVRPLDEREASVVGGCSWKKM